MRGKQLVVGFALTAALCASVFAGCGGGTVAPTSPGTDASTTKDVGAADTSKPDTGGDPGDSAVACVTDASLSGPVPDAAINDAGASTGVCNACAQAKCTAAVTDCNLECECVKAISELFTCLGDGGSIISCGSPLLSGASTKAGPLGTCIFQSCAAECGINFGGGGGDAGGDTGPKDASGG